jgi:hypothetical protein
MKKLTTSIVLSALFTGMVFAFTAGTSAADTTSGTQQAASSTQQTATQQSSTQQTAVPFTDVPQTNPSYVSITFLRQQNILGGYSDGTFKPDQLVNRAEALKILLTGNKTQLPASVTTPSFKDYSASAWFAPYVEAAKSIGIVSGNPDGTFAPSRNVTRAEFLKMLLTLNSLKTDKWANQQMFTDVPANAWYAAYMNYAGQAGLIAKDSKNMLYPSQALTRADVAEIYYLLFVIRNDKNTQFLVDQSEAQMAEIEIYIGATNIVSAKRASDLAIDFSQEAYINMPTNNVVLAAAKLAKAYGYLMSGFIAAVQKDYTSATSWANEAISKATEAWQADNTVQPYAKHIKDRANEILTQIAGTAGPAATQQTQQAAAGSSTQATAST